ncbi:hypothetical protein QET40_06880 [Akkermansia sp. N21169]|uniref:hypothetical protein n=1 Tax=Akkermansia sp. N21169 TaxID=3040765 RepID=UPI00244E9822|nr:hypothetical protein [Akkermansia sp. N21169]MDH3068839.1 hypothetical protein [Akkermansia sp. N21169]
MAEHFSKVAKLQNQSMTCTGPLTANSTDVSPVVCMATAVVEMKGTEAVNDTIKLVYLPGNAVVLPHLCRVQGAALGAALSVKIGDGVDDDAYSTALDIKAAHDVAFTGGVKAPVKHDGGYWVTATVTAATTPTAGAVTNVLIAYSVR